MDQAFPLSRASAFPEEPAIPPVRAALRVATDAVHQRMHRHPGFEALAEGRITAADYRALLARLLGFHLAFEHATGEAPRRSRRLAEDLRALGADAAAAPLCPDLPALASHAARLGAAYVAEGAALGGRVMAKALNGRPELLAARSFLSGDAAATGARWSAFLARLESEIRTPAERDAAVGSAVAVFLCFERWMEGWQEG